jgi:hypothetical protein
MALIDCPDCGQRVSDQAAACPQCAYPFRAPGAASGAPKRSGGGVIQGVLTLAAIGVIGYLIMAWAGGAATRPAQAIKPSQMDRARAVAIDPRLLVANPRAYVGQNVLLQGQTLTVTHERAFSWVQLQATMPGRFDLENIAVEFYPPDTSIQKGECVTVYAVMAGVQPIRYLMTGAEHDAPVVRGYEVARKPATLLGCFGS